MEGNHAYLNCLVVTWKVEIKIMVTKMTKRTSIFGAALNR